MFLNYLSKIYGNYVKEGKHGKDCNATESSKDVWELKRKSKIPLISSKAGCKVYGNQTRNFCRLCLKQKLLIIKFLNKTYINVLDLSVNVDTKIKT